MPRHSLKKCPLCGSYMKLRRRNRTIINGKQERNTFCYCKTCDLRGPRVLYKDYETSEEAEQKAINLMNRRYDDRTSN